MTAKDFKEDTKTSKVTKAMCFDDDVANSLNDLRDRHQVNISKFVNASLKTILNNQTKVDPQDFSEKFKDYRRIDLVLHQDVVKLLEKIIATNGYCDLAIALSYLIAYDSNVKNGYLHEYQYETKTIPELLESSKVLNQD